jgi:methylmalonyl-CoA mutase C-terminal domain/subunit
MTMVSEISRFLKHYEATDIAVIVGGIIPAEDIPLLKEMGVKGVFPPETPLSEIVSFVRSLFPNQ